MKARNRRLLKMASRRYPLLTQKALAAGADVNYQDNEGCTALHIAAYHGNVRMLRLLLNAGADVGLQDNRGATPLVMAAWLGGRDAVQVLLDAGAGKKQKELQRAIRAAIIDNGADCIPLLCAAGARMGLVDYILLGDQSAVRTLLAAGADVNHAFPDDPPLLEAIGSGIWWEYIIEMVELLLEYGADLAGRDRAGRTAIALATLQEEPDVVEWLRRRGAPE